jgi:hypothetical protein
MSTVWILVVAGIALAQEPPPAPPEEQEPEGEAWPVDQDQQPIPIPIRTDEETRSLGLQTFADDVFQNARNHWGFSLSAYQAYTTDVAIGNEPSAGSGITAFLPRIFFNAGKRKSNFHLDLGAGYRLYNGQDDLNNWDYYGNAQYTYRFSRRTSFQLSDQFTSSYNDAWSFLSLYSPINYNSYNSNEVLFNRQRINRNLFLAELNHQATRKARFGVFGGYKMYDYPQEPLRDSDAIEAGGNFYYQLAKWLYFDSSFSTYFNLNGGELPDANIYRLKAGGLDFHLTDRWRVWASGGVDVADYEDHNRARENVNTGIGYTSRNTSFNLTYHRGFASAIGIAEVLYSDIASAYLGYRINSWLNAKLESYYYRSTEEYQESTDGLLENLAAGGGLEFLLRRDLIMTLNAYYQNQKTRDFSVEGLDLNRFTGFLGIQYVWPARRR